MRLEGLYGEFDHVPTGIYMTIDTSKLYLIDNHSRLKNKMFTKNENNVEI
jgi:hypothetical protein